MNNDVRDIFILVASLVAMVSCGKENPGPAMVTSIITDLSVSGTANCYIVPTAGNYKFKATVKGNSTESVGTPVSAEVLWESFGTDVTPDTGDIIKNVFLDSGYVFFSSTTGPADGNAVVAVKDASGNILWSWHIWVCKDFYPSASAQVYYNNAGTLMDRNLGAVSSTAGKVTSFGLLYQWGRKDPFLGPSSISKNTEAKSTLSWPAAESSDERTGTIAYSVAHPTTFITRDSSNYDWYYTGTTSTDNTRWESTKTMYDPCPTGWRVPDGGVNGVWSKAFGTASFWITLSNWDSANKGMDFGKTDKTLGSGAIWYPAGGLRSYDNGLLYYVGSRGHFWSCTTYPINLAFSLYFYDQGFVYPSNLNSRGCALSVRCAKD